MIRSLDHIAIAVPDLQKAVERFVNDFGLVLNGVEDVETAQTTTAFFSVPKTKIELVHPLEGKGPIAKFLEKKIGGMHHLCFSSDDIDADVAHLSAKGYVFLSEQPYLGAHGKRVIFIHPKCCDGVLIELSEYKEHGHEG